MCSNWNWMKPNCHSLDFILIGSSFFFQFYSPLFVCCFFFSQCFSPSFRFYIFFMSRAVQTELNWKNEMKRGETKEALRFFFIMCAQMSGPFLLFNAIHACVSVCVFIVHQSHSLRYLLIGELSARKKVNKIHHKRISCCYRDSRLSGSVCLCMLICD